MPHQCLWCRETTDGANPSRLFLLGGGLATDDTANSVVRLFEAALVNLWNLKAHDGEKNEPAIAVQCCMVRLPFCWNTSEGL